ncbi:porin [Burkholderia sp. WAC0059]|uniref:porin n=1 Tax=Burkholderia sp. WAC0059 TaxID=2066022 RepID=UPI000C7EC7DA|nr:porin [Burkholderia sp. WAC0059]PLZ03122.1 porin [Burkholderia sp. WAC0059]
MKTIRFAQWSCLLAALGGLSGRAFADGVSLSGMIDSGVTYVSNENGHSTAFLDSGIAAPDTFSIRGQEALGGDWRALFNLTSQFNVGNGTTVPSAGEVFNRTALVGLASDRYGSFTAGTQYDFMTDSLTVKGFDDAFTYGGLYDFRQGPFARLDIPGNPTGSFDFDRMGGTERVTDSVKYQSPSFDGLSAGGLYGFGGTPGSVSADSTTSFGLNYGYDAFALGLAYVDVKYPEFDDGHEGIRTWGAGLRYRFRRVRTTLLFTRTQNTESGAAVDVYKMGASGNLGGPWSGALDYTYMKGNEAVGGAAANQFTATLSYALSPRTKLYAEAIYQRTNSDDAGAWINGLPAADSQSSSRNQVLSRIGLLTSF